MILDKGSKGEGTYTMLMGLNIGSTKFLGWQFSWQFEEQKRPLCDGDQMSKEECVSKLDQGGMADPTVPEL